MGSRIDVDALPEFDPAQYLDNKESIAVYLTGILEANDAALLASALGDVARARVCAALGVRLMAQPMPSRKAAAKDVR